MRLSLALPCSALTIILVSPQNQIILTLPSINHFPCRNSSLFLCKESSSVKMDKWPLKNLFIFVFVLSSKPTLKWAELYLCVMRSLHAVMCEDDGSDSFRHCLMICVIPTLWASALFSSLLFPPPCGSLLSSIPAQALSKSSRICLTCWMVCENMLIKHPFQH